MCKRHIKWVVPILILALALGITDLGAAAARALDIDIEINEANFPDPFFRNYVSGKKIDLDRDGMLSAEEIAAATEINVSDMSIASMQGLAIFTALEQLYCNRNQLTELDISKNANLQILYCFSNQLTELDVSNSKDLEWLGCDWNQLTELNVSNNINLSILSCAFNQLTELDVSKNINLIQLDCSSNNLTELDISQNTKLEWLNNSGNQMAVLKISNDKWLVPVLVALVLALASCAWIYHMIATRRYHADPKQAEGELVEVANGK